jgi:diadenosine tetraphosphatase ApaH/serine/threonine PP2A family protein phosphatase
MARHPHSTPPRPSFRPFPPANHRTVPSLLHIEEEILDLLRGDPHALLEALQRSGQLSRPDCTHTELYPGEIRLIVPTEWRLDLLFLLHGGHDDFALPVESQPSIDRKRRASGPSPSRLSR